MGLFKFLSNKTKNFNSKSNDDLQSNLSTIKKSTDDKIVDSLNKEQKWAILELLSNLAKSDGLTVEEKEILLNLSSLLGIKIENKRFFSEHEIYETLKNLSEEQKSYLCYMVFTMVAADGKFTKEEHEEVNKLLSRAEIESSIIDDLFEKFGDFGSEKINLGSDDLNRKMVFNKSNQKKIEKYENGDIKTEYYVNSNGENDGPYKRYYEGGGVLQDTFFIAGKQNYENDIFDQNGKLLRRSRLIDGEYVGDTEEFYNNGKIKSIKSNLKGYDNNYEIKLFNINGKKTAILYIKEIFHEENDTPTFPGVILYSIQKLVDGINFLPYGVWEIYDENENLSQKIDFEISKPTNCIVNDRQINFDYCSFELTKYIGGKIISRDVKPINELNSDFFSNDFNSTQKRSNYIYDDEFDVFEFIIKTEEFILPIIERANKKETIQKFEVSDLNTNWIKGFKNIYKIPKDPQVATTAYLPLCYESEQTIFHPIINQEITFVRGFMDMATYCEKDALKIINEIMIFNGGVSSFRLIEDSDEGHEIVFQSPTILVAKSFGKPFKMPINSELSIDAEFNVITVTHLPPKNISGPFDNLNGSRGIHWDSAYINKLLLGLNKPIYCKLDGGIMDGRFHVMDDKRSDIIFSIDDKVDINPIKKIIKEFSKDNNIINLSIDELNKIVESYSLNHSIDSKSGYKPNLSLEKEDTILSFIVKDKLMISYNLINSKVYQTRIDKKSKLSWDELKISDDDEFEFYISELDKSDGLENFNDVVKKLFIEFEEYFDNYDEFEFWDKYEISDIDLKYWLKVIRDRAGNNLMNFKEDKDLDQLTLEWIWGHADEYKARLENPHGDPYNQTTFDESEKLDFLKIRVVAFGDVYKQFIKLRNKINDAKIKYSIDVDTTEKHLSLEIAHAKSSLYGTIKYALSTNISKEDIKFWFDAFEDNSELLSGNNPFDSINMDEGLAALSENKFINEEFNIDMDEVSKMSDEEIINQLNKRGISSSGTRNELIVKLILSSNEELLKSAGIKTNN